MFWKSAEALRRLGALPLRVRLTILFALVTSLAMSLLGVALHLSLATHLDIREREQLLGKLTQFRYLLRETPDPGWLVQESARLVDVMVGEYQMRADVLDVSGRPLVAISGFSWPLEYVRQAATLQASDVTETHDGRYHFVLAKAAVGVRGEQAIIGLAHDRSETLLLLSRFRTSVFFAVLLGSLLAGGLGYVAAVRSLAPLRKMVETARRIRAEHLAERLHAEEVPAELRDLAISFNDMLSRLEESFQRLSQFSADLAHELRTPLGNLMLHAQVALDRPRTEPELREVVMSGLEELQRLSRMVNDMLFLAKADHAQTAAKKESIDLAEEVEKVTEFFEPLASERSISVVLRGKAEASADRSMLRRLLANLLSNAVRYASAGSTVEVLLESAPEAVRISVANEGPALTEEECRRVFDRFYRKLAARSESSESTGLGLAIVKSIVDLHGGWVAARNDGHRNIFSVVLPRRHRLRPEFSGGAA